MLGQGRTTDGGEKMSKKLDLGDSKLAFQKPDCQAMLPAEDKNLSKMIHMRREILEKDKDVIHVDKAERKITQIIHKVLELIPLFLRLKGMQRNLNIPKPVMITVFRHPLEKQPSNSNLSEGPAWRTL